MSITKSQGSLNEKYQHINLSKQQVTMDNSMLHQIHDKFLELVCQRVEHFPEIPG
jgi:hypothetical protein